MEKKMQRAYEFRLKKFCGELKVLSVYITDKIYIYNILKKGRKQIWYLIDKNKIRIVNDKNIYILKNLNYIKYKNKKYIKVFDTYLIKMFHNIHKMEQNSLFIKK